MVTIPVFQVDAFTSVPFRGNPAAVCLLSDPLDDSIMQNIAAEMNLSETAFVCPMGSGTFKDGAEFSLRWFTPTVEVPLCGHATLATSAILFFEIGNPSEVITFHTKSGELTARKGDGKITLDFPAEIPEPVKPPLEMIEALGITELSECLLALDSRMLLVIVEVEKTVTDLRPDFRSMLTAHCDHGVEGVIVSSKGNSPYDFISRFFGPWLGIDEDPVTGAAHTILAPYWSQRLGKGELKAYQASSRGGELDLKLGENGRVEIIGSAVVLIRGEMTIPDDPRIWMSWRTNIPRFPHAHQ